MPFFIPKKACHSKPTPDTSATRGRIWKMEVSLAADTDLTQISAITPSTTIILLGEPTWGSSSTVHSVLRGHSRV